MAFLKSLIDISEIIHRAGLSEMLAEFGLVWIVITCDAPSHGASTFQIIINSRALGPDPVSIYYGRTTEPTQEPNYKHLQEFPVESA
jgi:hypothetical protein